MPRFVGLPVGLWLSYSACNATIAPEPLLLFVVSLSAPSGWRRSRWRVLCAVTGFGSTQDYPVVTAGLGVAAFTLKPSIRYGDWQSQSTRSISVSALAAGATIIVIVLRGPPVTTKPTLRCTPMDATLVGTFGSNRDALQHIVAAERS